MRNQDTLYWVWLAEKCGVQTKLFNKLIEKYENPFDIYRLEESEIEQFDGLTNNFKDKLSEKNLDASYEILRFCAKNHVDIISYGDSRYPQRLKNIEDPPIVLYCKGHFPDFNSLLCIGIVGTRKMSEYGKQSAYDMAYDLASANVCTVSGMALGVDALASCGALSAGGITVAVLGCGIDVLYPKHHKKLMDEISRHGAVITEYPPKEKPHSYNFPKRNRIISGLCQGLLVVEAPRKSGAMITADLAIAQGKEVFALPGKISDENSEGPNELIKSGAYSALSAGDIIKKYEFLYGDVTDSEKLLSMQGRRKPLRKALEKYGLDYALSDEGDGKAEFIDVKAARSAKGAKDTQPEVKDDTKAETSEQNASAGADGSADLLDGLDALTRRIFESIPQDKAISVDQVMIDGASVAEVITALTMLELYGLVCTLPGGLYMRK